MSADTDRVREKVVRILLAFQTQTIAQMQGRDDGPSGTFGELADHIIEVVRDA